MIPTETQIDTFLSSIDKSFLPSAPGVFDNGRSFREKNYPYPILIGGQDRGAYLVVMRSEMNGFAISMQFSGLTIFRAVFSGISHLNPPKFESYQPNLPTIVSPPYYLDWESNRPAYILQKERGQKPELKFAKAIEQPIPVGKDETLTWVLRKVRVRWPAFPILGL